MVWSGALLFFIITRVSRQLQHFLCANLCVCVCLRNFCGSVSDTFHIRSRGLLNTNFPKHANFPHQIQTLSHTHIDLFVILSLSVACYGVLRWICCVPLCAKCHYFICQPITSALSLVSAFEVIINKMCYILRTTCKTHKYIFAKLPHNGPSQSPKCVFKHSLSRPAT